MSTTPNVRYHRLCQFSRRAAPLSYKARSVSGHLLVSIAILTGVIQHHNLALASIADTVASQISIVDPTNASGSPVFDFGAVRSGEKVTHTFTIRNDGAAPVLLDHALSSCDCTSAILTDQFGNAQPKLEPGKTAEVKVTLDTAKIEPSRIATLAGSLVMKGVAVYAAEDNEHPVIVLRMQGRVTSGIAFDPPAYAFGAVSEQKGTTGTMRVTFDADRYAEGKTSLVATDPRVSLKLVTTKTVSSGRSEQEYQVIVPRHAAVGALSGTFSVVGVPSAASVPAASFTAPFAGEIVGDVRPEPQQALFGSVPMADEHGKPLSVFDVAKHRVRWVLLVNEAPNAARNAGVWKHAQATVDAPWLRATLVEPPKPGAKPSKPPLLTPPDLSGRKLAPGMARWVRIELLTTAKSKTWLSGNVTVTLANGEQILVPASGQIE